MRGQLAELLVSGAEADQLHDWISLAKDSNWTARWWLVAVLREHYPDAPQLDHALPPEDVENKAEPILPWYEEKKGSTWNCSSPDAAGPDR